MRKPIMRVTLMLLGLSGMACRGGDTARDSISVSPVDSTGVGRLLAARADASCPSTVTINPENCRWKFNTETRSWQLVCDIGAQQTLVDATVLNRLRRDSTGVGRSDSTGVGRSDSTGVGALIATTEDANCPNSVVVNPENCHWLFDKQTRAWKLVCRVGPGLVVVIDTSAVALGRLRRDSTGVGR
jgi:hypothetical protein